MEGSKLSEFTKFKVALIGSSQIRVAKVVSLINDDLRTLQTITEPIPSSINQTDADNVDNIKKNDFPHDSVEYIPCVATFESYEDGVEGKSIRYLAKVEYHGPYATRVRGSSLAPFFDDNPGADSNEDDCHKDYGASKKKPKRIPGIAAVAIGCGIETEEDVAMIVTYLRSMSANKEVVLRSSKAMSSQTIIEKSEPTKNDNIENVTLVQCIQPNVEYESMEDENKVYKLMSSEEKKLATLNRTIGPGKMSKFVQSLAHEIGTNHQHQQSHSQTHSCIQIHETQARNDEVIMENIKISKEPPPQTIPKIENIEQKKNKNQFACKQCRLVLLDEDHLENPPHQKAQHTFNRTKINISSSCNSLFLAEGLEWMGDISSMEGKLFCPKCSVKLGLWKWAGAQCSCGTWVTPAIKLHLSKIDVIPGNSSIQNDSSHSGGLPPGTILPRCTRC